MRGECLVSLPHLPRGPRSSYSLDASCGVYALFLKQNSILPKVETGRDGLLYIGKATGGGGFKTRCHFGGRTVNHSPRKSLAVLLMAELGLVLRSFPGGKWGLDVRSEDRLSEWMHHNLEIAIANCMSPTEEERRLILEHKTPLNLTICEQGPQQQRISLLRSAAQAVAVMQ